MSVSSGGAAKANFALQAQGVIQGVVFDDLNGNKEQDLGEPGIAGVTITSAGGPNTTTGDDGSYRFSSVSPGSYTLVVSVPAGYAADGRPVDITMVADFLGEPALIAAAYAFEQATQARRAPDLEATLRQIE